MAESRPSEECPLCKIQMHPPTTASGYEDWRDCPNCGLSRQLGTLRDPALRRNARAHHLRQLLGALAAGERARGILLQLKEMDGFENVEAKGLMSHRLEPEFSNAAAAVEPLESDAQGKVLRALDLRRRRWR